MKLTKRRLLNVCKSGLLVLSVIFSLDGVVQAQGSKPGAAAQSSSRTGFYLGAVSCASGSCHGSARPRETYEVRQDEYLIWVKLDKHAKAYSSLLDERSKKIARHLGIENAHEHKLCLDCHAINVPAAVQAKPLDVNQGVSCEACHGPAGGWLSIHTEKNSHARSVAAGMTDLRSPAVRAGTCLECHLGSPKKGVDHELIAAGHPDLVFELDNYSDRMPRHWLAFAQRKNQEGRQETEYTRAWMVGQAVAFQKNLERLADRAGKTTWPEYAELDCYSCHRVLRNETWRQAARSKAGLGLPKWSPARFVMLRHVVGVFAPSQLKAIEADVAQLEANMFKNNSDGAGTAAIATRLAKALTPVIKELETKRVEQSQARRFVDRIVKDLPYLLSTDIRSAEQVALAVNTLVSDITRSSANGNKKELAKMLESIAREVERPERFDPKVFGTRLQQLQRELNRRFEGK